MRILPLTFVLSLMVLVFSPNHSVFAQETCETNFLMIGDSITQGLMRSETGVVSGVAVPVNGAVLTEGSYGPELSDLVLALGCDQVSAFNWGVGGENSAQIRVLVQSSIIPSLNQTIGADSLTFALIMVGVNDAFDMSDVSDVVSNIDLIVSSVESAGVVPILSAIPQIKTPGLHVQADLIDNLYNPAIYSYAAQTGVQFVDMPSLVSVSQYHSGDLLHYSEAGYTVMADVWFEAAKPSILSQFAFLANLNHAAIPAMLLLLLD